MGLHSSSYLVRHSDDVYVLIPVLWAISCVDYVLIPVLCDNSNDIHVLILSSETVLKVIVRIEARWYSAYNGTCDVSLGFIVR